jgi:arsenical pump membrane protein
VNNLPAAVLLGSRGPAHPQSLLFGLDIGPNLAVTGSLSALIWWQAARAAGARPSARRYSLVGAVLVPLTIAAALAARSLPPRSASLCGPGPPACAQAVRERTSILPSWTRAS